ncbi:MAG: PIG-L family deacetylase [Desulfobacterales bacterium]|nr:MAG: PIG-L family deacetylase [Desulfobacterales bacterium]UCD88939.1 MAG: PIG-L family deacetylase [Desulfobacterales bacterium]
MTDTSDIMVISAHPDDSEFGSAGSVAKWTQDGRHVVYVVCTSGDKGTSKPDITPKQLAKIREKEQRDAAAVLGVSDVVFLGYPDQELEDTPYFRKAIVRQIRTYKPETIVTSDPYRRYIWHRDHRIVGQVTLDAVYPYARDLLAYPDLIDAGLMPHKVKKILFFGTEDVNLRIDITETFHLKLAALRCHESQITQLDIPDLEKWLWQRCQKMAEGTDFEVAEAFHQVEIFR